MKNDEKQLNALHVFNLQHFNLQASYLSSFPVLFNQNTIKKSEIKTVQRSLFFNYLDLKDSSKTNFEAKRTIYFFDKNGFLNKIQIADFYDNMLIDDYKLVYKKQNEPGFAQVKNRSELVKTNEQLHFYHLKNENNNRTQFVTGNHSLFVIPSKKNWNAIIIDTLCKPNNEDVIVWGSVLQPQKIYQVENLVNEYNTRTYKYSQNHIQQINWTQEPFSKQRSYHYNSNGFCDYFVDSTFSLSGDFLATTSYKIKRKNQLPSQIIKTISSAGKTRTITTEKITYTFN